MANFTVGVTAGANDYTHAGVTNEFYPTGNDNTFGKTGGGTAYHIAALFAGVTIAQGSTINACTIALVSNGSSGTGTLLTKISAVDEDNAAIATSDATCDTDDTIRTTTQVDWDPTLVGVGTGYTTADFSSVSQEIINRGGWASGNGLLVHIDDDGNTAKYGTAASYEHASYTEPTISITYTVVVNASTSPATVGAISGVPAVTVTADAATTPATVGAIAGVPAVTVVTPDASVTPATVGALAGVPAVTVTADAATTPATVGALAGVPAVTTTASVTVTPATVGALAGVPAVIAFTVGAVTVTIDLLAARTVTIDLLAARTVTFTRPCA